MRALIGLGSNQGDRLATLRSAVASLAGRPHLKVVAASAVYETAPMGPSPTDFCNAVVEVETTLDPEALLDVLLAVERVHGRVRGERWGPRTLDLDFLLALDDGGPIACASRRLTLPHAGLLGRDFVLRPILDLRPELAVDGRPLAEVLALLPAPARTIRRVLASDLWPPAPF
jgi:2-amino-4-hydroxy-6-hydroxymethyldihydropteridine diphosphokinase